MHIDSPQSAGSAPILTVILRDDPVPPSGEVLALDVGKFHSGRWALQLDAAIVGRSEPIILVAMGVACLAVAWWAKLSPKIYTRNIEGAIFEAPLHVGFGQAHVAAAASVSPSIKLPFPSIVTQAASPIIEQVLTLADGWGSYFVEAEGAAFPQPSNRRALPNVAEAHLLRMLERARETRLADLLGGTAAPRDVEAFA